MARPEVAGAAGDEDLHGRVTRRAASSRADPAASARWACAAPSPSCSGCATDRRAAAGCRSGGIVPDRARTVTVTRARATMAVEQFAHPKRAARAHVVRAAGHAMLGQRAVRPHRVAHVGEVAPALEVAHADDRLQPARLDERHLPRDAGREERRVLPRTDVVERPRHHGLDAVDSRGARHRQLRRDLADGVRVGRLDRIVLGQRAVRRAVDVGGARHHDPARTPSRRSASSSTCVPRTLTASVSVAAVHDCPTCGAPAR